MSSLQSHYSSLCELLKVSPLKELQLHLLDSPTTIDVSNFYFPRKHLHCLLKLVQERPDVTGLILDGVNCETDDVKLICDLLSGCTIQVLSLKNVLLDATSGDCVKQLCKRNSNLIEINLDGTLLSDQVRMYIQLVLDSNRIQNSTSATLQQRSAIAEKPLKWRWRLESVSEQMVELPVVRSSSPRAALRKLSESNESYFCDEDFDYSAQEYTNIKWMRVSSLMEVSDSKKIGAEKFQAFESKMAKNSSLCSALNLVQQYGSLKKKTVAESVEDMGFYAFRFFVDGQVQEVVVDDLVPCQYSEGIVNAVGVCSSGSNYWCVLVEKAFAKVFGGYKNTEKLTFSKCIAMLTGGRCFQIIWKELSHLNTTEMFELFRDLLVRKKILFNLASPQSALCRSALSESGIILDLPYVVLNTNVFHLDPVSYEYVVQIMAPGVNPKCSSVFLDHDPEHTLNGSPLYWITFENFVTLFESTFIVLGQNDENAEKYRRSYSRDVVCHCPPTSSAFGTNPAFLLVNQRSRESEVILTVTPSGKLDESNGACVPRRRRHQKRWMQMHLFKAADSGTRRYDISEKNMLLSSKEICNTEGSIIIRLQPNEQIQVSLSASEHRNCLFNATFVDDIAIKPFNDDCFAYTFRGEWNEKYRDIRVASNAFWFINTSQCQMHELVVAVEQSTANDSLFGISVSGWIGRDEDEFTMQELPHVSTDVQRERMAVFKLQVKIDSGKKFALMPCCYDDSCYPSFNFTVYSQSNLSSLSNPIDACNESHPNQQANDFSRW